MDKVSMILSAILMGGMLVFYAPNVFALNRGHILRNIALWLAIFAALGLIYQNFGPGSAHPLFKAPMTRGTTSLPANVAPADQSDGQKPSDDQSFTPPKD